MEEGAQVKKDMTLLSVGKDIKLNEILEYLSLALVGHFCGKLVGEAAPCRWMDDNWKPYLNQILMFHILSYGLILFRVKSEEDRQKLLDNSWKWWPSRLILKRW